METGNGQTVRDVRPFVEIEDVSKLIPILEKRLPIASVFHNCAVMYPRFKDIVKFYTLYGEIDESSWIVSTHFREDFGMDYSISADKEKSKVSDAEAKKILSECRLFNWDESYFFVPTEKWLSKIIFDVSCNVKGLATEVHPCYLFYMDIPDALQLDASYTDPAATVQRLDRNYGVDFIVKTWFYSKEGTETVVQRAVERNESAGVYIDGKPVAGVYTLGFGIISALYTLKEHRNKGYAKLTMKYLFKELAKSGIVPALCVELVNQPSYKFHESLGCKVAGIIDAIIYTKAQF